MSGGFAVAGDGGDGGEVAMPLTDEIIPAKMDRGEKGVDVDVHGCFVDAPVERVGEISPAGVEDEEVETAETLGQDGQLLGGVGCRGVVAGGEDLIGVVVLEAIQEVLSPAGGATVLPAAA